MRILITGGAGYIGSHMCVAAFAARHDVGVLDNFCNSDPAMLDQVSRLAGRACEIFVGDVRKPADIDTALESFRPDAVIHLAGLKAVGESVAKPLDYFATNVHGTAVLLSAMSSHGVRKLIFSSSATVYGEPTELPLKETHQLQPTSPYGRSKLMAEWLCADVQHANPDFAIAVLRYFNPAGAHESGLIGENPRGHPNNLMPYLTQVACGRRHHLEVFGDDYPTPDGSGVRDYLHVCDLAEGHLAALRLLAKPGITTLNLGTGQGSSVLELVAAFEDVIGRRIPYLVTGRRSGDVAAFYADPSAATRLLGWRARRNLADMCRDAWAWQSRYPDGLESSLDDMAIAAE